MLLHSRPVTTSPTFLLTYYSSLSHSFHAGRACCLVHYVLLLVTRMRNSLEQVLTVAALAWPACWMLLSACLVSGFETQACICAAAQCQYCDGCL